eukprot:scaffold4967_cov116-Isochrysis_galbana.AAC.12
MCVGLFWGVSGRLLCLLLSLSLSFFRSDTEGDDSTVTRYTVTAIPVSGVPVNRWSREAVVVVVCGVMRWWPMVVGGVGTGDGGGGRG